MTKTHKAVLSTLAVLCLLFMGSGVAQAQVCSPRKGCTGIRRRRHYRGCSGHRIAVQRTRRVSFVAAFDLGVPREATWLSS